MTTQQPQQKQQPTESTPLLLSSSKKSGAHTAIRFGDDEDSNTNTCDTDDGNNNNNKNIPRYSNNTMMNDESETSRASHSARSIHMLKQLSERFSERVQSIRSLIEEHTGSIGMLGSISIAVNSLTGPAMITLPATFVRSGIVPTIACLVAVCLVSALCSLHMANTISKVPGNADYKKEVEFSQAFGEFWGTRGFVLSQMLFFGCVTCLNISSIVDTAQVVDTFLGHWMPHGGTAAVLITKNSTTSMTCQWIRWDYSICSEQDLQLGQCVPFHDQQQQQQQTTATLLTAGNLITTLFFLPLALMDLKENATWQVVAFAILLGTALQFAIQFATWPDASWDNVSLWGDSWNDLLGVIVFNFSLLIAIPAWLYEREPHVHVPTVIHASTGMSAVLYVMIGLLGSMALPNVSENMLESMMSGVYGTWMQLGASFFAFAIIGLGIPLFSVLTRLNLTAGGTVSPAMGNVLAVYVPFAASWVLHDGTVVTKLLSWGGVIFTSLVAFIMPLVLTLHAMEIPRLGEGSIDVYFGYFREKNAHVLSLRVLLFVTVVAIVLAIGGNFW